MLRPLRVDAGAVRARPYEDRLGRRLMITCQALGLTLQGCVNETDNGPVTNVSTISHSSLTHSLTHSLSLPLSLSPLSPIISPSLSLSPPSLSLSPPLLSPTPHSPSLSPTPH